VTGSYGSGLTQRRRGAEGSRGFSLRCCIFVWNAFLGHDPLTVRGHFDAAEPEQAAAVPYTQGNTCPGYPTCNASCQSCMQTCGYTYYPCCQYA
jgi:hypothetical protein